jgi:hypothetical protein
MCTFLPSRRERLVEQLLDKGIIVFGQHAYPLREFMTKL